MGGITNVLDLNMLSLGLRDMLTFRSKPKLVTLAPEVKEIAAPAAVSAPVAAPDEIAAVLSPSQVRTFTDCQVKWMYKYILDEPETRSAALGLGSAFHEAVGANYREKITSKQDMPSVVVANLFRSSWVSQLDSLTLAKDDDVDDLEEMGAAMVETYMDNVAPLIQPAAVEVPVSGVIAGVKVRGKIDVLTEDGTIIDSKTASKKPCGVQSDYRFQVSTYVQICGQATGKARVDTVTKTKTIATHSATVEIGEQDRLQTERMYPLVQEAMKSGLFVPNRNSFLCSKKHCGFAARCEAEYGGVIDDR